MTGGLQEANLVLLRAVVQYIFVFIPTWCPCMCVDSSYSVSHHFFTVVSRFSCVVFIGYSLMNRKTLSDFLKFALYVGNFSLSH